MSDSHEAVFVDGVHYRIGDGGHADLTQPLRWEDGGYRPAADGEATHNDVYHSTHVELDFGGEVLELSGDEAEAVKAFLAERRGEN